MMKTQRLYASLASQLGDEICSVADTEDIFWLREADDYQSRFRLGSALAAQYRFKDALTAFKAALRIKQDDQKLWYSLAGAELTLRRFSDALQSYQSCLSLGADKKKVSYPLGIAAYLQKDYKTAAEFFEKCLPCDDEMLIAIVYWHSLASYRAGIKPALLEHYHAGMNVGHHVAYQLAVSVFSGETTWGQVLAQLANEQSDLNNSITLYGISVYLETIGQLSEHRRLMSELLKRDSAWPCVSYLAAWNDCHALEFSTERNIP